MDNHATPSEPLSPNQPTGLRRLFIMRDSRREELDEALRDPFRSPKHFGLLRYWLDESPHSLLAALLLILLLAVLTLTLPPPGDGGMKEVSKVGVEQVVLGTSPEELSTQQTPTGPMVSQRESDPSPAPLDSVHQVKPNSPQGAIPVDSPPPPSGGRKLDAQAQTVIDDLQGLRPLTLGGSSAGSISGAPLSDIFVIDPSVKSVVYVIDKSGSMASDNKLARVQAELIRGIQALTEQQRFSVVFFDHTAWPLHSRRGQAATGHSSKMPLLSATPKNKAEAESWVRGMYSGGNTNPLPAVMLALGADPEMIKLLSDGEFSGSYVRDITRENKTKGTRQTRIDCIGLGEVIPTLQDIARQNRGVYYQAR